MILPLPDESGVAAIIPTYNRAVYLRECLESLLALRFPFRQILVVDDGSSDGTSQVAQAFGESITLLRQANRGKAAALNLAMRHCTAEHVWICDDDDVAFEGVEKLAAALDKDKTLDFAYGDAAFFDDGDAARKPYAMGYRARENEPNLHLQFLEGMFTPLNAMLVRRRHYERTGPFREELIRSQDYDMAIRLSRRGRGIYVPGAVFLSRVHHGARGSAKDSFPAALREAKWLAYDRMVLSKLRHEYALSEFLPFFAFGWGAEERMRASLVERARVFARRAMWQEALEDIQAASPLGRGWSHEEIELMETAVHRLACWEALRQEPESLKAAARCRKLDPRQAALIQALCRPLIWHMRDLIREGRMAQALRMATLLLRLCGPWGAFKRVMASLGG